MNHCSYRITRYRRSLGIVVYLRRSHILSNGLQNVATEDERPGHDVSWQIRYFVAHIQGWYVKCTLSHFSLINQIST